MDRQITRGQVTQQRAEEIMQEYFRGRLGDVEVINYDGQTPDHYLFMVGGKTVKVDRATGEVIN